MSEKEGAIYNAKELGTGKTIVLGLQHMFAMFQRRPSSGQLSRSNQELGRKK